MIFFTGAQVTQLSQLDHILANDNSPALELELAIKKNNIQSILYPRRCHKQGTLFHLIVQYRAINCFRLIVSKGNSKDFIDIPDDRGRTPLHISFLTLHDTPAKSQQIIQV